MHVARQRAIERRHANALNATYEKTLRRLLERAETKPYALATLIADAVVRAGVLATVNETSPEIPKLIRVAAQSGTALFALARSGGEAIELPLGDIAKTVSGKPDDTQIHVARWLDTFWTAALGRDTVSIVRLLETSTDELRRSPTKGDEFHYHLVDALRAAAIDDTTSALEHLRHATRKTDAESLRILALDRVEEIEVPVLAALTRLLERDEAGFAAAIRMVLELHGRFWNEGERRDDLAGLVCVRAGALLVMAKERGIVPDITSDFVPALLLDF
ncbi:immunity 49 family protein [Pendulispora albinea]|uniref:Immunity 49 family protein n=1 Tax=Pendulispora albinea TaxID=2741071 RepID=A0ABZ2LNL2_9BACT